VEGICSGSPLGRATEDVLLDAEENSMVQHLFQNLENPHHICFEGYYSQ